MSTEGIPRIEPLAPVLDRVREIAQEELPPPRACKIQLWDDGDYDIWIYHKYDADEREQVVYDCETGEVRWQYLKNPSTKSKFVSEVVGTEHQITYEQHDERVVTTIEPPRSK